MAVRACAVLCLAAHVAASPVLESTRDLTAAQDMAVHLSDNVRTQLHALLQTTSAASAATGKTFASHREAVDTMEGEDADMDSTQASSTQRQGVGQVDSFVMALVQKVTPAVVKIESLTLQKLPVISPGDSMGGLAGILGALGALGGGGGDVGGTSFHGKHSDAEGSEDAPSSFVQIRRNQMMRSEAHVSVGSNGDIPEAADATDSDSAPRVDTASTKAVGEIGSDGNIRTLPAEEDAAPSPAPTFGGMAPSEFDTMTTEAAGNDGVEDIPDVDAKSLLQLSGGDDDSPLAGLLKGIGGKGAASKQQVSVPMAAVGSGFVYAVDKVAKTALIVTNSHVVTAISMDKTADERVGPVADRVVINFYSGKRYNGTVLGKSSSEDVAVVRVENFEENIDALQIRLAAPSPTAAGQVVGAPAATKLSGGPQLGEWVVVMGNPLDLEKSVTLGIVSSTARVGKGLGYDCTPLIQTDAAINAGNSGGPLFDAGGGVLGIVTSKLASAEGVAFAIPSVTIKKVVDAVLAGKNVEKAALGIQADRAPRGHKAVMTPMGAVTVPEDALTMPGDPQSLVIASLTPGGPAEGAGLKVGDELVSVNGQKVGSKDQFAEAVCNVDPQQNVKLEILRHGRALAVGAHAPTVAQQIVVMASSTGEMSKLQDEASAKAKQVAQVDVLVHKKAALASELHKVEGELEQREAEERTLIATEHKKVVQQAAPAAAVTASAMASAHEGSGPPTETAPAAAAVAAIAVTQAASSGPPGEDEAVAASPAKDTAIAASDGPPTLPVTEAQIAEEAIPPTDDSIVGPSENSASA